MKQLILAVAEALRKGERVVLCTILASSGSSPRGAGARMAVFADGRTMGTVGGGQVELLATAEALEIFQSGNTRLRAFCLAPEQVASIGMNCGGNVTIYYQLLTAQELCKMEKILSALETDANSWLYLSIEEGKVKDFEIVTQEEAEDPALFCSKAVLRRGELTVYAEPLMRAGKVYIFGGGHVGQALVPVLAGVGFRVCVYDNRRELAKPEYFPMAHQVIYGDYEDISSVKLSPNDYAVIMTPAHQADFVLLEQVLRRETKYVGCIGSRSKIAKTRELLRQAGICEEAINSVHSPIGLSIGAETPAEIAISIAAELISCRAEDKN